MRQSMNRAAWLLASVAGLACGASAQIQWKTDAPQPVFQVGSDLAPALTKSAGNAANPRVIVHLHQQLTPVGREVLAAQGLTLLAPLGDQSFFARIDPKANVSALATGGWVAGIAPIDPRVKIHPKLAAGVPIPWATGSAPADARPGALAAGEWIAVYVQLHDDVLPDAAAMGVVDAYGGVIRGSSGTINMLVVEIPRVQIAALANESIVQWIEPAMPALQELNAENRAITGVNTAQAAPYNLTGAGVKVLVFDGGSVLTTHQDLAGRVTVIDGSAVSNHSTHVAGTIGGTGAASAGGVNRGMAPGVTFLSAAVNISGVTGWLYTNPCDIEADYTLAYGQGAHLASNSIGTNTASNGFDCLWEGDYQQTDRVIDAIVRGSAVTNSNPFRIVWAAGNERSGGGGRCGTSYRTVGPPAGAKNHLSIGATNANDDSMTSFSGWGPTDDGRMKPDFSAPGCQSNGDGGVTSCGSASNTAYSTLCGTSMATPTVSGATSLLLQDFRTRFPARPDPRNSTLKVLWAQNALDLGNVGPDYQFGYGRIQVPQTIDHMRTGAFTEDSADQAQDRSYTITVPSGAPQLKLTLAWDDVPGVANVAPELVNDLDLELYSPTNTRFYAWTLDPANPANPAVRTQRNSLDNLEQVLVDNPQAGTWTVRIKAFNVPQGPQPFSLAATYTLTGAPNPPLVFLAPQTIAPSLVSPGDSVNVSVRIVLDNDTLVPGSAKVWYRTSTSGPFSSVPLTNVSADIWTGTLPGLSCGDTPQYYFEARGTAAGVSQLPSGGPAAPYAFDVGTISVVASEDFEASAAGWVGGQPGDTATTGIWNRMDPQQTLNGSAAAQPGDDTTPAPGVICWVTDGNAGASVGANDVDNGFTTLLSAPYNLAGSPDATVAYSRWYYNAGGGDTWRVQATTNGTTWTTVESTTAGSSSWTPVSFRIGDFITPGAATRFRFVCEDINTGNIVEAAIDDFRVTKRVCENPVCDADANGDGNVDQGDVDYLINVIAGGANPTNFDADFDHNGVADQGDVDAIITVVAGGNCP